MELLLPPDLQAFVTKQVESGSFPSASDVIHAGLRLLLEQESTEEEKLEEELEEEELEEEKFKEKLEETMLS